MSCSVKTVSLSTDLVSLSTDSVCLLTDLVLLLIDLALLSTESVLLSSDPIFLQSCSLDVKCCLKNVLSSRGCLLLYCYDDRHFFCCSQRCFRRRYYDRMLCDHYYYYRCLYHRDVSRDGCGCNNCNNLVLVDSMGDKDSMEDNMGNSRPIPSKDPMHNPSNMGCSPNKVCMPDTRTDPKMGPNSRNRLRILLQNLRQNQQLHGSQEPRQRCKRCLQLCRCCP